jgi:CBS domain containing-hemolysin-like protein
VGILNVSWAIAIGVPLLFLHLLSVTLTKALRNYSRSQLEDYCALRGRESRADDVSHKEERTERSAETLAVLTGLALAALLGVLTDQEAPHLVAGFVVAIALGVGGLGYVIAGVIGRVFAEPVIDALWPYSAIIRFMMSPLTFGSRQVEALVERLARPADAPPRPSSVEVEIPADGESTTDLEADIPETTRELLQHAVALTRRDVSELMTPRSLIVTLPSNVSAKVAASTFRETGKSRLPLYGENRDDIVGVLYAKDLFPLMSEGADPDQIRPRKLVRPAYCIPQTKNAYELLGEFRDKRAHLAIVVDEYGGVAGLITLEDLVEELVGAIEDEHDTPPPRDSVVSLGGVRYEVVGTLSLEELNERLNLRLPTDEDFLTVAGLAFHALNRLPEPGATFRYDGIEFEVAEIADHSIRRVRIDLRPAETIPN